MPVTTLTVYEIDEDGVAPVYTSATADVGDQFVNTDRTFVHVVNGSGAPIDAVIQANGASIYKEGFGDVLLPNITVSVTNGTSKMIKCPPARFNSDGYCTVICSAVATVTIAAIKVKAS